MRHIYTEGYVIITRVLGEMPAPVCLSSDGVFPRCLGGLSPVEGAGVLGGETSPK